MISFVVVVIQETSTGRTSQQNFTFAKSVTIQRSRMEAFALNKEFFSKRAYFIVDREGLIRWSFVERELGSKRVNDESARDIMTGW